MAERVTVKAPATTANMGPGFDCLGMALDIWNTVSVELGEPGLEIREEDNEDLHPMESNLIVKSFRTAFAAAGKTAPPAMFICENVIPLGKGLGSSSAAAVCGLIAGNELAGRPLSQERILELAVEVEGHPDNSAAALLGGCQIVASDDDRLVTASVPIPEDLSAVVLVPDVRMPTSEARSLLTDQVSRADAVFNMGRVGLLVRGLATGDFSDLATATQDKLHQPARQSVFHPMGVIFRAALDAGALGVFLSGSGSSILALANDREMTIGYEMAEAASKAGVGGDFKVTKPSTQGAHVVSS